MLEIGQQMVDRTLETNRGDSAKYTLSTNSKPALNFTDVEEG